MLKEQDRVLAKAAYYQGMGALNMLKEWLSKCD